MFRRTFAGGGVGSGPRARTWMIPGAAVVTVSYDFTPDWSRVSEL